MNPLKIQRSLEYRLLYRQPFGFNLPFWLSGLSANLVNSVGGFYFITSFAQNAVIAVYAIRVNNFTFCNPSPPLQPTLFRSRTFRLPLNLCMRTAPIFQNGFFAGC
jgi:hypothetical protein